MKRHIFLCFALLVSCQPQAPSKSSQEKVVQLNLAQNPNSIDPRIGGDRRSQVVTRMLFDGLVRVAQDGSLIPSLAKEIHLSDDRICYTFTLKEAKWSDGTPITAYDFEYSWKKLLRPDFPSTYAFALYSVKGARAVKMGHLSPDEVGIKAIDPETLTVELESPTPYFLHCVANGMLAPVKAGSDEQNPRWSHKAATFISNGPFRLVRWDHDAKIVVEKNPHYWDQENVHLDRIEISIMDDARNVLDLFEKGQLHWAGEPLSELPLESLPTLRDQGKLKADPVLGVYRYEMNVERPPFTSSKMRRAFAHAIDREALVKHVLKGEESIAHSLLPAALTLQEKPLFETVSPSFARFLFEEALKEEGWTRETMPKITLTYTSLTGQRALAQAVQQQWQKTLNIPIELEALEWNAYLTRCDTCDYQIAGCTWYSWYDDPIYNLENIKHRTERFNPTLWEDPAYIKALDASNRVATEEERNRCLKIAEDISLREMPVIPVFTAHYKYVIDPHLKGVVISRPGYIDFKWADLEPTLSRSVDSAL